jgi:hypothetical protein
LFKNIDANTFETESGIKLGLTFANIIGIKGRRYTERKDKDIIIITYEIKNENNVFLKK